MNATTVRRMRAIGVAFVVCALSVITPAAQVPTDKAAADAANRRAADRITALQREADGLAARERTLVDELRRLEVERDLKAEQYAQNERYLAAIQRDLVDTASRIGRLEERSRAQIPALSSRMVELYKLGRAGYVRLLLSVDDLREAGRAYRFVSALQELDHQRIAEHGRTLADLRTAQASLEHQRSERLTVLGTVGVARAAAEKSAAAQAAMIRQIDERRDLAAQLMGDLQVAQDKLQQRLAGLERGTPTTQASASLPLRPFRGDLDWPAAGSVLTAFGRQRNPRFSTTVVNNGIRIAAASGTPVKAIHEGTVVFAEPFSGFGNLLILDHGGQAFTMYGTLATIDVPVGTHVARGQTIGSAGASIEGTPSIYFELRVDGKPVDPLQWLRKR